MPLTLKFFLFLASFPSTQCALPHLYHPSTLSLRKHTKYSYLRACPLALLPSWCELFPGVYTLASIRPLLTCLKLALNTLGIATSPHCGTQLLVLLYFFPVTAVTLLPAN